ncbi:cytochrome P450-dit2 [Irineochytrium annulatum]|nr:cytochrome P450-dit2 [Irineochytrium annulatum]
MPRRTWLVVAAVATPVVVAVSWLYVNTRKSKIDLPGPKPFPVLGFFPEMMANRHRRLKKLYEDSLMYGPNWVVTVPTFKKIDVLFTVDPAVLEHVLKTNFENYIKGPMFSYRLEPLLGQGILTGRMFREVVGEVVRGDVGSLVKKLREAAETGSSVDLHQYFHNFTLDTFGKIGFGDDFGSLKNPDKPPPFAVAFDSTLAFMVMRFINLFWRIAELFVTGKDALRHHLRVVDEFAMERIRGRRELRARGEVGKNKDLLDLFMAVTTEGGGQLSDRQLRDVILNMILAGRDTTAQALAWTFLELTRNASIVEKIREEVGRVLGHRNVPTFDEIPKLKYTNAVFMETMRLHPSVPMNVKIAVNEDVLPGGIHIPAGTEIGWLPYAMGRQTSLWGPDALEFKPERWIEPDGSIRRVSPFVAIAFNAGPRVCLGQQMATVEAVMAIVGLCNEFDFETVEKDMPDPAPSLSLTNGMAGGLPVYVKNARQDEKMP